MSKYRKGQIGDMGAMSRFEWYNRSGFGSMQPDKKVQGTTPIRELMKEIEIDAPFRGHKFLFNRTWEEIQSMEAQEQDGLSKFKYKTEGQRFSHIKDELISDNYETIRIYRDINHPTMMHLSNGFHRIFMANKLGIKELRTETWYGTWELNNNITLELFEGYLKNFKSIYVNMFNEAMKDENQKGELEEKKFPDISTIDGAIKFMKLMQIKDKNNNTRTILGCDLEE